MSDGSLSPERCPTAGHPQPQVSIVIPCFNQASYLPDCIRSIQEQNLRDWEIVVVDDASTDADVQAILSGIGDDRIRLVRHEANRGLAAARNTGFSSARARLILPVDADDRLHPAYLSTTLAAIRDGEGADCAFTDWQIFGASTEVWRHPGPHGFPTLLTRQTIPGAGTLMARGVWERAGGYREAAELRSGNEDWEFWIAAMSTGVRPAYVPQPLYLYRHHDASMSMTSLSRDAHVQHNFIYLRHREIFERYRDGGRFRASGYRRSAAFARRSGQHGRALALLLRGLVSPGVGPTLARMLGAAARRRLSTVLGLSRARFKATGEPWR